MRKTVYERIIEASKRGTGIRLSPDDVAILAIDTAVIDRAANDCEYRESVEQAKK